MKKKQREAAEKIIAILKQEYPKAKIALEYKNPLQLLIAVILSAQCTDKQVNKVTPNLFKKYKSAKDFANADIKELETYVHSTGFYHNKAKNIQSACKMIVENYDNKVPGTMGEILKLPGVARKTANIVLGNAYGIVEGIAVDTHVSRLSQRLGLTKNKDAIKIEQDLMEVFPKEMWLDVTYYIIEHGRAVCKAPVPVCSICTLKKICPKKGVEKSK